MGSETTTTQKVDIAKASEAENQALQALLGMLKQGGTPLDALARGDLSALGPTGADQQLVQESIGRSAEMARRAMESQLAMASAGLDEELAARGIQGSDIEGFRRAGLQANAFDQIQNAIMQAQQQGSQALMQLPFQRANVQLNANQALFNRILGAAAPILQSGLQERIAGATTTQTEKTPMSAGQAIGLGAQIGGLAATPFTGGASLMATGGIPSVPGIGPAAGQSSSLLGGFQQGLGIGSKS